MSTDLAEICQTVLPRPDADRFGLRFETDTRPAPLEGDPRLLERLVANLVDNAIGHNIADGCVQISTDTSTDGKALLTVTKLRAEQGLHAAQAAAEERNRGGRCFRTSGERPSVYGRDASAAGLLNAGTPRQPPT